MNISFLFLFRRDDGWFFVVLNLRFNNYLLAAASFFMHIATEFPLIHQLCRKSFLLSQQVK